MRSSQPHARPLFDWIWRLNVRMALIPLLIVELLLVGAYLLSNTLSTDANIEAVQALAQKELALLSRDQAQIIERQLRAIQQETALFQRQAARAYQTPYEAPAHERERYAWLGDTGAWYTTRDNGGAALFYSGLHTVGPEQQQKALQLSQLDPLMRDLKESDPLIVQLYVNTWDSMNRIYPWFPVQEQYPPSMDIPSYNFYYEADAKHNPTRGVVWTEAYIDPAGQGWLVSAIAPVYQGRDRLEAVVGLDITLKTFVHDILQLKLPWGAYAVLLDRAGTILALPEEGERDWGLKELREHHYAEAILQDTFKPDSFNVFKRPDTEALAAALGKKQEGSTRLELGGAPRQVAWSTIPGAGWRLLIVAPEAEIFREATALGQTYRQVGWSLLLGLGIFYALFLAVLYRRTRSHSLRLSEPLERIGQMVAGIEAGQYHQRAPSVAIEELRVTAEKIAHMGRRLEENNNDLINLRDRALESSRLKSAFMASMSHELRTPMHNILGASELLLESPLPDEERALARSVHDAGGAMLRLIDDLLDIARIESGHLSLDLAPFSPQRWLQPILGMFEPRARLKGLALTADMDPALPERLLGDTGRLRQLLVNLLGNALKFTDAGRIEVHLKAARSDESLTWVRLEVRDTGIGIPPEAHDRLFQPFTQVDGSHSRKHEGVGLGLSICRQLTEAMGGQIGVESQPGEGSTFWVELPLMRPPEPQAAPDPEPPLPQEAPSPQQARILIVDDNPLNLNMLQRVLRKQSYEVERAASGPEALALLEHARVDLILTDVHMPGMDGVTLAAQIRARLGDQTPPIVAVTADAWQESRATFLAQGMDDCITKPYQLDQLRALVRQWLERLPDRRQEPPQR